MNSQKPDPFLMGNIIFTFKITPEWKAHFQNSSWMPKTPPFRRIKADRKKIFHSDFQLCFPVKKALWASNISVSPCRMQNSAFGLQWIRIPFPLPLPPTLTTPSVLPVTTMLRVSQSITSAKQQQTIRLPGLQLVLTLARSWPLTVHRYR